MGRALPGKPISTTELLQRMQDRFGIRIKRSGQAVALRLGIENRFVCRDLMLRHESPRKGHSNAELAASALQEALKNAGIKF